MPNVLFSWHGVLQCIWGICVYSDHYNQDPSIVNENTFDVTALFCGKFSLPQKLDFVFQMTAVYTMYPGGVYCNQPEK